MLGFLPLALPTASISSINTIQGAFSLACLKRSLTREAPTPTNISTKSDPANEKKGTSASPATALANNVLPVPGGATNNAPLGIFPPKSVYFCGSLRSSTSSSTSCLASARPATSLNVTLIDPPFSKSCAFDFPTLNTLPADPPPPLILLIKNIHKPIRNTIGSTFQRITLK